MSLLQDIQSDEKIGSLYHTNCMRDSYLTGIAPLDYALGYWVNVHNEFGEIEYSYPLLGIESGTMTMNIGKSSTAKTALMLYLVGRIVAPYKHGLIMHYDLEQAMNLTRAKNMLHFTTNQMKSSYVLRQGDTSMDGIKKGIMNICKLKLSNPQEYMYDTGKKDEYGNPIIIYEPTVILIDSIPSLSVKLSMNDKSDWKKLEEVSSQPDKMRLAGEIGRFYNELLPYVNAANIMVFSVNHIRVDPGMGLIKSPAELLYLDQGETLPGGKGPVYASHNLLKNIAVGSEKYTYEDDGFDGFLIRLKIIKCRSNQAGRYVYLVYDTNRGISGIRSSIYYAKENGLIGGNKNSMYFINNKDVKFSLKNVEKEFSENKNLYQIMYDHIIPPLEKSLAHVDENELMIDDEQMLYGHIKQ